MSVMHLPHPHHGTDVPLPLASGTGPAPRTDRDVLLRLEQLVLTLNQKLDAHMALHRETSDARP